MYHRKVYQHYSIFVRTKKKKKKMSKRTVHGHIVARLYNRFDCGGQCGKSGCEYFSEVQQLVDNHIKSALGIKDHICKICALAYVSYHSLRRHVLLKHKERFSECGYTITTRASVIRIPLRFKQEGVKQHEYHFLCTTLVRNCILYDVRANKFSLEQKEYTKSIDNNIGRHKLADDVLEYVIKRGLHLPDAIDDCGGYLSNGFHFGRHSILSLSLDRKNNNLAHFMKDVDITHNLRFICKGFNTHANIVGRYGSETCHILREKIKNGSSARDIIEEKRSKSQLRTCCKGIWYRRKKSSEEWRDNHCHLCFGNVYSEFFEYCYDLLKEQKMRCAISNIFLEGMDASESFFKLSVDAIKPRLGHIKGNIRIICRFLNSTNHDKSKTIDTELDCDNEWTSESFKKYIGLH